MRESVFGFFFYRVRSFDYYFFSVLACLIVFSSRAIWSVSSFLAIVWLRSSVVWLVVFFFRISLKVSFIWIYIFIGIYIFWEVW